MKGFLKWAVTQPQTFCSAKFLHQPSISVNLHNYSPIRLIKMPSARTHTHTRNISRKQTLIDVICRLHVCTLLSLQPLGLTRLCRAAASLQPSADLLPPPTGSANTARSEMRAGVRGGERGRGRVRMEARGDRSTVVHLAGQQDGFREQRFG